MQRSQQQQWSAVTSLQGIQPPLLSAQRMLAPNDQKHHGGGALPAPSTAARILPSPTAAAVSNGDLYQRRYRTLQQSYAVLTKEHADLKRRSLTAQSMGRKAELLERRTRTLETDLAQITAAFQAAKDALKDNERKLQSYEERCTGLETEVLELRKVAELREPAFLKTSQDLYNSEQQRQIVTTKLLALQRDRQREVQDATLSSSKAETQRSALLELQKEVTALRGTKATLATKLQKAQEALAVRDHQLKTCIVEFSRERSDFVREREVLKLEVKGQAEKVRRTESEVDKGKGNLAELSEQMRRYIQRHESDRAELAALTGRGIKYRDRAADLESTVSELQEDIRIMRSQRKQMNNTLGARVDTIEKLKGMR